MDYSDCFYLLLDDGYYIADRKTRTYWRSNRFHGYMMLPEYLQCPKGSYVSTVGSIGMMLFGKPSCLWGFKLKDA